MSFPEIDLCHAGWQPINSKAIGWVFQKSFWLMLHKSCTGNLSIRVNLEIKYFEMSVTSMPRVTSVTQSFICVTCSSGSFCSVILIMMSLLDLSWNSNFHKILMVREIFEFFYAPEWSYHHFIIEPKINFQPNHTILYNKSYPAERAFRFLSRPKPTTDHLEFVLSSLGRLKLYWGSGIILVD